MIARQRQEEKYVSLCFAILSEYLACSSEAAQPPSHCPPHFVELLATSCLLPALAAYLVNDSGEWLGWAGVAVSSVRWMVWGFDCTPVTSVAPQSSNCMELLTSCQL